jgi:glyoxylase-like metal-dependent hydrolase (beta-lactamase superfamily II)
MEMKAQNHIKLIVLCFCLASVAFLFYLFQFLFSGYDSRKVTAIDATSLKIDSLIEIQKVNENCILIKFGADAITAINTNKGIVVIDAGISPGLTARYRKIIENEYKRNDFTYVINSHGHPDHIGGNTIFPEAGIAGHVNSLQEVSGQLKNREARIKSLGKTVEYYELQLKASEMDIKERNENFTQRTRYLFAYNDAKNLTVVRQPDITFSDSLKIDSGDTTFEMIWFGKSHSNSDILIYVPEMNILFTGDLFSRYGRPGFNGTSITDKERWKQSVRWVEKRMKNIEKVIDGHGGMLSADDLKSFNNNILNGCSKE